MSAIPWVGQDIVESNNTEITVHSTLPILWSFKSGSLPKIGIANDKSRTNRSKRLTDAEYLSLAKSFLAFLAGFIDGDGYIGIFKTNKGYVKLNLAISIHLDDILTLNYIQSVLKLGKLYTYPKRKSPTATLIFTKTDLQEVLFPLFIYHGIYFLTETRKKQYDRTINILSSNTLMYSELAKDTFVSQELAIKSYLYLPFFKDWLVGFVAAEGSFFMKCHKSACFQIKQRLHINLFEAFKLVFNTDRKITLLRRRDKLSYMQFSVSSKADIQNVINFFSFQGHHPLIGLKNIKYLVWLDNLRKSVRYDKLNFPN